MPFLILIGALVAIVASTLARGFVLSILWGWFLVPLGLPAIGIASALGVALVIGMITHQDVTSPDREIGVAIGIGIVGPFLVLLMGWIIHLFM